jgi:Uncharacterised nucleotidyltransferase
VMRRLVTIHGLAAHVYGTVGRDGLAGAGVPADTVEWLAAQDAANAVRIDRIHGELRDLLAAASRAGLAVAPLKGALLSTLPGSDPHRRPMADIDVLVRPVDVPAVHGILVGLGYERVPEANPRPTHDVYLQPGARVVSIDEHPDNPRRVEVHTELVRHLWAWLDADELTARLWERATPGHILGEPALVPALDDVLAHVAIHASSDLLIGRGRLVQWLDVAELRGRGVRLDDVPHERIAFPALALAARVVPRSVAPDQLERVASRVPASLRQWAARVQIDDRCGLMVASTGHRPASAAERWRRWRPERWRLAVAYGDTPLPLAAARHVRRIAHVWRHRLH